MIHAPRPHRLRAIALGALLVASLMNVSSRPAGAVPLMMNYQGFLTDNTNTPVSANLPMTFKIYADSTGGAPLWTESYAAVSVSAGVFNLLLGRVTPLPLNVFTGAVLWLQTTANGADLLPRRPIVTVAYAMKAAAADFAASGGSDLWTAS